MKSKIIQYYGVEIELHGFSYRNDPALRPSYEKGTSHKKLYLIHRIINKRFKTKEDMANFMKIRL